MIYYKTTQNTYPKAKRCRRMCKMDEQQVRESKPRTQVSSSMASKQTAGIDYYTTERKWHIEVFVALDFIISLVH